jgi:hypothetical protein
VKTESRHVDTNTQHDLDDLTAELETYINFHEHSSVPIGTTGGAGGVSNVNRFPVNDIDITTESRSHPLHSPQPPTSVPPKHPPAHYNTVHHSIGTSQQPPSSFFRADTASSSGGVGSGSPLPALRSNSKRGSGDAPKSPALYAQNLSEARIVSTRTTQPSTRKLSVEGEKSNDEGRVKQVC